MFNFNFLFSFIPDFTEIFKILINILFILLNFDIILYYSIYRRNHDSMQYNKKLEPQIKQEG